MKGQRQVMSSARTEAGRDDWATPESVLERVRRVAPIGLDPCCSDVTTTTTGNWFTAQTNGLIQDWRQWCPMGELAYVNWPYSLSALWAEKVALEARNGVPIIVLCASRTDTRWWSVAWNAADVVAFWRGRIRFLVDGQPAVDKHGRSCAAPFPSALLGFNVSHRRFRAAFSDVAEVVVP